MANVDNFTAYKAERESKRETESRRTWTASYPMGTATPKTIKDAQAQKMEIVASMEAENQH
jgi:hypothetical protein